MLNEDETAPVMPGTSRTRLLGMTSSTGTIHLTCDPDCFLYRRFALHGIRENCLSRGRVNRILLVHTCKTGLSHWQRCASCVAPCLPSISSRNGAAGTRQQGKPKLPRNAVPIFMQSDLRMANA